MNKKRNNKGFSLVELIVVVAIMAVLVGVLAPAYLRYVEKSREQKDVSAVAEVVEAAKIAASEEDIYEEIGTATKITLVEGSDIALTGLGTLESGESETSCDFLTALTTSVGESIDFASSKMTASGAKVEITLAKDATTGTVKVSVTGPLDFSDIKF